VASTRHLLLLLCLEVVDMGAVGQQQTWLGHEDWELPEAGASGFGCTYGLDFGELRGRVDSLTALRM
jgi:hypothetical protein